jgi:perosamine synthetase
LITCGNVGVVTANDDRLAQVLDCYRSCGGGVSEEAPHRVPRPYEQVEFKVLGSNSRMTGIQAVIADIKLGKLDRFIEERQELVCHCDARLQRVRWKSALAGREGAAMRGRLMSR